MNNERGLIEYMMNDQNDETSSANMSTVWRKNLYGKKNLSLHQEIIAEISQTLYLRKGLVKEVVDEYLRVLKREIIQRGDVIVKGLFSIKRGRKPAHRRRHIKTGKVVEHPESEHLVISLAQPLRDGFRKYHGYHGFAGLSDNDEISNTAANNDISADGDGGADNNNDANKNVSKKRRAEEAVDFNPILDDDE